MNERVIMTMTTCKRFSLFCITLQTLFRQCLDCQPLPLLIVDDGTLERREMQSFVNQLSNHTTIIWKPAHEKGHDRSMNRIQELTAAYDYVLHLEDDWEFFAPFRVSQMIHILEDDPRIGQVMINQDYQERADDPRRIIGSRPSHSGHYRVHIWDPTHSMCAPGEVSNGHWPHYSLRPSLVRRSMWKHVGRFPVNHLEFEKEYGYRYMERGYYTAFLPGIRARHLAPNDSQSAYHLNKVRRFV